jgi:hypothetical protein
LGLIEFPGLLAYEKYREALGNDREAQATVARAVASGCIVMEERSLLQRVYG